MAEPDNFGTRDRPHLSIDAFREATQFSVPTRPQNRQPRRGDYAAHASALLGQLAVALGDLPATAADTRLSVEGLKSGAIVQVSTLPPHAGARTKAVKIPAGLEFSGHDIVVLHVERRYDRAESALLFVPDDARDFLADRIANYGRDPGNRRRPDVERFEVVETISAAPVRTLFADEVDLTATAAAWWEVWVQGPVARSERLASLARSANLDIHASRLQFPETTVIFVHSPARSLAHFAERVPGAISEIRRATGTIEPFLDRGGRGLGQHDWVAELAARVLPPPTDAPTVCALDTGVAANHPLIAPGLTGAWAYDATWGSGSSGTESAIERGWLRAGASGQ